MSNPTPPIDDIQSIACQVETAGAALRQHLEKIEQIAPGLFQKKVCEMSLGECMKASQGITALRHALKEASAD